MNFGKNGSPGLSTDLGFTMDPRVWTSEGPISNTSSGQIGFLINLRIFRFSMLILF